MYFKNDERKDSPEVAYFSMEIGLRPEIKTYSGGLGILAGDTLKAMADLDLPTIGITLVHKKGYFKQKLLADGWQVEEENIWNPSDYMELVDADVTIKLENRDIKVRAWQYNQKGLTGGIVPIFFLDTDFDDNNQEDRALSYYLYGGDNKYRLKQEAILGIAGARLIEKLGYSIKVFHMNEGHASLLTLELLKINEWKADIVKEHCVFTTHTPVSAGHDKFSLDLVSQVLDNNEFPVEKYIPFLESNDTLNTTILCLNLSRIANAVAMKHAVVSRNMFPGKKIIAVTNGIHSTTWTCPSFAKMFDDHIPEWRNNSFFLRNSIVISDKEMYRAHIEAKKALFDIIKKKTGKVFDTRTFTLGFARRATGYKRAHLIFQDPNRLRKIVEKAGNIQIVFAGKAHPRDTEGKENIKMIFKMANELKDVIKVVYLEGYDMELAKYLVSGVDVWLNTPERPREASGTSGMKAAINGVPNLSVLDGWWIEGNIEDVTGWSIGPKPREVTLTNKNDDNEDATDLYNKLEYVIMPKYYGNETEWLDIMKGAIALNASFFSTYRMVMQYITNVYLSH